MLLTERFVDALLFAAELHREQRRKGTEIPYVSHLLAVCSLVIEHGGSEDQAIAALLHDAVEDQGGEAVLSEIRDRFGAAVAAIVADCTDAWTEPKPEWRSRKEAYLAALPSKPAESLLVSLADKVHNASAILSDHRLLGDALWQRLNGGREGTTWYYRSLSAIFKRTVPGALADHLARTVLQFASRNAAPKTKKTAQRRRTARVDRDAKRSVVRKRRAPHIRWTRALEAMPAITIRQPWAWLIVNGYKDVENRSWRTRHRGTILIHAGASRAELSDASLRAIERRYGVRLLESFDLGGVIGTADVEDCRGRVDSPWHMRGAIGWVLSNPRRLKFRPCKGALSIFKPSFGE